MIFLVIAITIGISVATFSEAPKTAPVVKEQVSNGDRIK